MVFDAIALRMKLTSRCHSDIVLFACMINLVLQDD